MKNDEKTKRIQQVYIIGCKSIGMYGGYETFVMNLLQHHRDIREIQYHVACKANGQGCMNLQNLLGVERTGESTFRYCNAECFLITVPEKYGAAQAIFYDLASLDHVCRQIEEKRIANPIVYILASRIGPFEKIYVNRIHKAGGLVYQNPDGHENWRKKWCYPIRKYWKLSERFAVKNADLVICDSKNIESYIQEEYTSYQPKTTFIAYGANVIQSSKDDNDTAFTDWCKQNGLKDYYLSVGRFVPENNFETMIREFMLSKTDKDFAIVTTKDNKFLDMLEKKLHFSNDPRIKFVGAVYDTELLQKIRENAYGYLHGHEVGGTNPSLLESLGSTSLNLLLDVGFNREVAEDAALYWTKKRGNLAALIDEADRLTKDQNRSFGERAKQRIKTDYNWEKIGNQYLEAFLSAQNVTVK